MGTWSLGEGMLRALELEQMAFPPENKLLGPRFVVPFCPSHVCLGGLRGLGFRIHRV